MSFLNGNMLWNLLWIAPLILAAAVAGGLRRNRLLRTIFGSDERAAQFSNVSRAKRIFRIVLLFLIAMLLTAAIARPSWGKQVKPDISAGRDILVLFDVSKSMLSDDVKPTRMDHSKWLVREIVKKNPGDRFGLVAFAGNAFLVCPLTIDSASFIRLVDDLDTDTIPVGGTNIQLALEEAVNAFGAAQSANRAVILVTDGDELTGSGEAVVEDLAKARIPIFAVGVGDPSNPAIIRVKDENGNYSILKDSEDYPVKSPLNESMLADLARKTKGIYVRTTAANSGVDELEARIKTLERMNGEDSFSMFRPIERPAYPLAAAFILLCVFFCISEAHPRSARTMFALAFAAGLLFAVTADSRAQSAPAAPKNGLSRDTAQDAAAQRNQPARDPAPDLNRDAAESEQESAMTASQLFNAGLEQQQNGQDYDKARVFYERAISASAEEPAVRASSYQNLGVISHRDARAGLQAAEEKLQAQDLDSAGKEVEKAIRTFDGAEELYRESMRSDADGTDVIRNQRILLAERKQAEQLKKKIDELKELMKQARQQTQQAHDQQQQENQQQDQQSGEQNQQQDQQSSEQNQQQDRQSGEQNQQQDQQSGEQNQQQDQQQSGEQNQQQNQQSGEQNQQQDQQSGEQNQQQSGEQNQQQDRQSAQDKTRQAEETVSELEKKASELNQEQKRQAAQKAGEELRKARREQEQGNGEKAEEHLKNALDTLDRSQSDEQDGQDEQDEQKNQGDQDERNDENDQGDRDEQNQQDAQDQQDAQSEQNDQGDQGDQAGEKEKPMDQGEMDRQQAEAILNMMSKDELDFKDVNRMRHPARLNNQVEKDW